MNGKERQVPAAIGVPDARAQETAHGPFIATGSCFYWLHTHAADGIIHIESPVQRTYALGDFFDEWGQPLGSAQVGPAAGRVVALHDGQVYQGNPRDIPLTAHAQIQLDIGTPLIAPSRSASLPGYDAFAPRPVPFGATVASAVRVGTRPDCPCRCTPEARRAPSFASCVISRATADAPDAAKVPAPRAGMTVACGELHK